MKIRYIKQIISVLIIDALVMFSASAQYTASAYVERYGALADSVSAIYGVPSCIILSQAMLESGHGGSRLARVQNNHFGIKAGRGFARYKSVEESYVAHSVLLTTGKRYRGLLVIPATDYRGWANELQRSNYASEKTYAEELIKIIERYIVSK